MTRKDLTPEERRELEAARLFPQHLAERISDGQHLPDLPDPPDLAAQVTAADRLAREIGYQPGQPIDDVYRQRTYQALIARGESPAKAQRNAEFWSRLKASSPENVHGPAESIEEAFGLKYPVGPSITQDPNTGTRTYNPGYQPQAAATGLPAGAPPTILEYTRNSWIGMDQPINRFSLNPGAEYHARISGPAPTMFGAGDLPVITGSGVDPSLLRWVAWPLRHEAAFTESRAAVAKLIELSLEGDADSWQDQPGQRLVSADGKAALNAYWARIATWVNTIPVDEEGQPRTDLIEQELDRFYGHESGGTTG